jgi:undecaprenyl-diphosphatase
MGDPAALDPALAAALGALQGVAEFLPISSSGHLALAQQWLGVDPAAAGHSFNIVVHAGTLLAVLLFYRRDLAALLRALFRPGSTAMSTTTGTEVPVATDSYKTTGLPGEAGATPPAEARALLIALIVGTLPLALALAPAVESTVIAAEGMPRWIGAGFLITAALLAFSHRRKDRTGQRAVPRPWQALAIGAIQLVAILPGISRSGATMAAALALGLGRLPAARFSFLLSIPAILGASLKESLDLWQHGAPAALDPAAFAIGFLVSFVVGLLTLRILVALLVRVGLLPFVPYLVGLGLAVLVWSE